MQYQVLITSSYKNSVIPTSIPIPYLDSSLNKTKNWKTYINTDYGFEFKYPAHFAPRVIDECLNIAAGCTNDSKLIVIKTNDYGNCGFGLNFYRNPQNLNVKDWIKSDMARLKSTATTPLELGSLYDSEGRLYDAEKMLLDPVPNTYNQTYIISGGFRWPSDYTFQLAKTPGWIVTFDQGFNCGKDGSEIYSPALNEQELQILYKSFKFNK